jgi:microcystin degradation protein MlrC
MSGLLAAVRRLEARPGVACASLVPGFAYADVARLGFTVLATGDAEAAGEAVEELAEAVWARRERFRPELVPVDEAVARALAAPAPVVLAEVADNVGGGAPGNATRVLAALLEAGARRAVVVLHDPSAARTARAGKDAELVVGDPPLTLRGRVLRSVHARYRRTGSYMTGSEVDLGRCAVVEADGVEVVLTSRRAMPFDADHLRAVGIDPASKRILVAKSAIAWRAAFGDVAAQAIHVDTPGICSCRLETLPYRRAPRPIAPLDELLTAPEARW